MKRLHYIFSIILFALTLSTFFVLNIKGVLTRFNASSGLSISERTAKAESELKDTIRGRSILTEVYGTTHNVLGLDIIGAFSYIRDDNGIMQSIALGPNNYTSFISYMQNLSDVLKKENTPLVVVQLPDRGQNLEFKDSINYFGQTSKDMQDDLIQSGIDVLDLETVITHNDPAALDGYFLRSDAHLSTKAEYLNAKLITEYLAKKYSISFPFTDIVYNPAYWNWTAHDFWGNFGRSSGKAFSGIDSFETFLPVFDTQLRLTIPSTGEVKEGNFSNVMTNGYEYSENKDAYWVTNYGQWPQAAYTYENMLAKDGPHLLILCDSLALRSNTFLALNASSITVLDPRYFENKPYLAQYLTNNHYDAVIVLGSDSIFYGSDFISEVSPAQEMQQQSFYSGMWLDNINNYAVEEQGKISTELLNGEDSITLVGWAADFQAMQPLSALYLKIGDKMLPCQYGIERESVSSYLGIDDLLRTGFEITFPAAYLTDGSVSEIQFIQISADGSYQFAPVAYTIQP